MEWKLSFNSPQKMFMLEIWKPQNTCTGQHIMVLLVLISLVYIKLKNSLVFTTGVRSHFWDPVTEESRPRYTAGSCMWLIFMVIKHKWSGAYVLTSLWIVLLLCQSFPMDQFHYLTISVYFGKYLISWPKKGTQQPEDDDLWMVFNLWRSDALHRTQFCLVATWCIILSFSPLWPYGLSHFSVGWTKSP